MQINLAEFVKSRAEHNELEGILRSCVHCGFCNATCPTYQVTGDELDGPRGRIYLLKQVLEGGLVSSITQQHLDRCLSCRSCETTCPSGVEYGRLLDLGRVIVDDSVRRSVMDRIQRRLMLLVFPYQNRFNQLIQLARLFAPVLPEIIREKIPEKQIVEQWPTNNYCRKVLILSGCVQPTLAPSIDLAAAKVLDKLSISVVKVKTDVCCGALSYHLSEHEKAKALARTNIDQCWPYMEQGIEAIIMTASGCGLALKEYQTLLQYDQDYADKAKKFSKLVKDISEILQDEDLSVFKPGDVKVAYQSPCTLQHGQKLSGLVESILQKVGYSLIQTDNAHLCCGSAGVYSILQPELSEQLRENKLKDLHSEQAEYIATANIGCLSHLQAKSSVKVKHWVELLVECSEK